MVAVDAIVPPPLPSVRPPFAANAIPFAAVPFVATPMTAAWLDVPQVLDEPSARLTEIAVADISEREHTYIFLADTPVTIAAVPDAVLMATFVFGWNMQGSPAVALRNEPDAKAPEAIAPDATAPEAMAPLATEPEASAPEAIPPEATVTPPMTLEPAGIDAAALFAMAFRIAMADPLPLDQAASALAPRVTSEPSLVVVKNGLAVTPKAAPVESTGCC